MGKLRWYKRDPVAALEGMSNLSLEERGAYDTVLDLIYARDGAVDDDDRFICGWMRCDVRVWKRIRARLLDLGKIYVADGKIRNTRADAEVSRGLSMVASSSEAGKASARKREAEKNKNKDLESTNVEATVSTNSTTTTREDSEPRGSAPSAHPTSFDFDEVDVVNEPPKARLWRVGLPALIALGVSEKQARPVIGQFLKINSDPDGLLSAIQRAQQDNIFEPIAYISKMISKDRTNGRPRQKSLGDRARELADEARRLELRAGIVGSPEPFSSYRRG